MHRTKYGLLKRHFYEFWNTILKALIWAQRDYYLTSETIIISFVKKRNVGSLESGLKIDKVDFTEVGGQRTKKNNSIKTTTKLVLWKMGRTEKTDGFVATKARNKRILACFP